jgi:hypothetical protein
MQQGRDLAEMIYAAEGNLDFDYVVEWISKILPADAPQISRFEHLIDVGGQDLGEP